MKKLAADEREQVRRFVSEIAAFMDGRMVTAQNIDECDDLSQLMYYAQSLAQWAQGNNAAH